MLSEGFPYMGGVVVAAVALSLIGCGPSKESVCLGEAEKIAVLTSASQSDYATSRLLAPDVAEQAVERTADSCGSLFVAVQTNAPEADLQLRAHEFVPQVTEAFNRTPVVNKLVDEGREFVQSELLDRLDHAGASPGSPFFSTLVKAANELAARGALPATIVITGDGIAVEQSPSGAKIRLSDRTASTDPLSEFVPLLEPLSESCIIIVGSGVNSSLSAERLRQIQQLLRTTLAKAGAGFVSTTSPDLPAGCS